MSKISLTPNASGTGTFTIASPDSNTNRTLTLPDADGALLTADSLPSGGMTYDLLGTIATTSGSSVTLSGLDLTVYKQLQFILDGVSGTETTVSNILLNGFEVTRLTVNGVTNNATGFGLVDLASGIFFCSTGLIFSSGGSQADNGGGGQSGLSTASTSITFTTSAGTFDAGSISVYGVA